MKKGIDFKVNEFTTINNFVLIEEYETKLKFGQPYKYQKFKGKLKKEKVKGLLCLDDNNIFGLTIDN